MTTDTGSWILIVITGLALVATVVFSILSVRATSKSNESAEKSAEAAAASARAATEQLQAMRDAQIAALQPYIWADLRPRDDAAFLTLCVGNSGPTVATDITITFDPSLVSITHDKTSEVELFEARCRAGLRSIAPGATFTWTLDVLSSHFPDNGAAPVPDLRVTITATGPRGPLESLEYFIGMEDLKHQSARPAGLALIEKPLIRLNEQVQKYLRAQGRQ